MSHAIPVGRVEHGKKRGHCKKGLAGSIDFTLYGMNRVGDSLQHVGSNADLVRDFTSGGVEFILVGGLAVSWYCPDRQADDMDLLLNPTSGNSTRVSRVLTHLHMSGFSANSFIKAALQIPLKQHLYAELLTPRVEGPTYGEVSETAIGAKLFNIPIRLASPAMLIRMKQQAVASADAQRNKHLADIERLSKHVV